MSLENLRQTLSPENIELIRSVGQLSFDMDGVTSDTTTRSLFVFNKNHGTSYTLEDFTHTWRMDEWFQEIYREREKEEVILRMAKDHWNSREVIGQAEPLNGSFMVLKHLDDNGIKPLFITSRPSKMREITFEWFAKYFPFIDPFQLVMQTAEVYNSKFKIEQVDGWNVKVHFEDMSEHAEEIADKTSALVVIINHQWNEGVRFSNKIIRPPIVPDARANLLYAYQALIDHLRVVQ